ncbi:TetR/AcrR family transcriptional regulator [Streptomyces paludis]|uniref:TetR/AcrR family transcriptional regulator n=1 Tax=Streptomyces paludis TaxID=2282738 RepID=A0A345HQM5_9ACTN|nr:TetR/AcrR family transcriptional regulator [Streptomyces paludis]AXG78999.1 TetR/AcrR family transcriptional regulator [Streptomyces paludis]
MLQEPDRTGPPVRTSVWLDGRPVARTRRTDRTDHPSGLDRDRITAVSLRLLDAEGPGKFSMRRLAAELGVTAMSLYWYVDTKDDLLELALDAVFAEIEVPVAEGAETDEETDWREQLLELAARYRAVLVRHPWASPLIGKYLNVGPRSMDFSAAVKAIVARTGLSPRGQMGAIAAVFQFVYGFSTVEGHFVQRCAEAGLGQDAYFRHAMGAIGEQPRLAGAFAGVEETRELRGGGTVEEMRERDFTFALDLLVAGIETMRAREEESEAGEGPERS